MHASLDKWSILIWELRLIRPGCYMPCFHALRVLGQGFVGFGTLGHYKKGDNLMSEPLKVSCVGDSSVTE